MKVPTRNSFARFKSLAELGEGSSVKVEGRILSNLKSVRVVAEVGLPMLVMLKYC